MSETWFPRAGSCAVLVHFLGKASSSSASSIGTTLQPRDRTGVSCTAVDSLPCEPSGTQVPTQAGKQIQMFDGGGAAFGLYF